MSTKMQIEGSHDCDDDTCSELLQSPSPTASEDDVTAVEQSTRVGVDVDVGANEDFTSGVSTEHDPPSRLMITKMVSLTLMMMMVV
jgi:hypothetical protein